MYPGGQVPGIKREESARLHVNERRLPTPVNHLNTLRPQPPGPPSARALPFKMFRTEVSPETLSLSASHGYLNYSQPPVSEPSTSWALPTGVPRLLGSTGSMSVSVSVPHHSLNSSQPFVSGSSASWATVVPFTRGSAAPVLQPMQGNHSQSAQPWGGSTSRASEVSHSQGSSVPAPQPAFDYYHHTFPQPNLMSQAPRAVKRKAQKPSSPANISQFQNTFRSSSITSGYASSVHDGSLDERSSSLVGRATSDTATFITRSPTPEGKLKIIMEDPQNGHLHREKRIRTQEELDSQKEGMRVLKDNGGACWACYRSKKRCGPGDPCPPCAARNRECVRSDRNDGETVFAGGQPTSASESAPAQPNSLIDRPNLPENAPTEQAFLIDRPGLPENIPTEMTSNEDPPAMGCDLLEDYLDPFFIDSWQDGMNCIDSAYDNVNYPWVGTDANGHLTI
ncbi:hypothetical protein PoHVEF18_003646 [Penicillium ochrochloron]